MWRTTPLSISWADRATRFIDTPTKGAAAASVVGCWSPGRPCGLTSFPAALINHRRGRVGLGLSHRQSDAATASL